MKNCKTKIILLGTGTPNAEPDRSGPSVALMVDETPYIFDFGPGVVRRAAAAGLPLVKLNRAFLTHIHSDHTTGYPDLILTPWTLGRVEPLEVYGPSGIHKMTEHILEAYEEDIKERLKNVYFDTAASPFLYDPAIYRYAVEIAGVDKILFGSDFPLLKPARYFKEFQNAGLTGEQIKAISGRNAEKLLNL